MKFEFSITELEEMQSNRWLTDREKAVFDLIYRRGWCIEDTAAELFVHRSTVDRILKSIRAKTIKMI